MQTPAGWYPDPLGRYDHRYWDGARWTEHVSRGGQQAVDPLEAATASADDATDAAPGVAAEHHGAVTEAVPAAAPADPAAPHEPAGDESPPTDAATPEEVWATPGGGSPPPTGSAWSSAPPPGGAGAAGWSGASGTPPYPAAAAPVERRTNVQAVLSLVFALIWVLGLGSLAAIVLGAIGIKRIDASGGRETGKGLAIAGIVLGVLGLLSTVLFVVGLVTFARDAGISMDPEDGIVFDESALFADDEFARWTALYDTAAAQENHWFSNERYTSDLTVLEAEGLRLEPGTDLSIPTASPDAFCIELRDVEGTWHLDSDFYEVEEGPCPLG